MNFKNILLKTVQTKKLNILRNIKRISIKVYMIILPIISIILLAMFIGNSYFIRINLEDVKTNIKKSLNDQNKTIKLTLKDALYSKGKSMAAFIAKISPNSIYNMEYLNLKRFLDQATKDNDIMYAYIKNDQGQILAHSYNLSNATIKNTLKYHKYDGEKIDDKIIIIIKEHVNIIELNEEITEYDMKLGNIVLGLSTEIIIKNTTYAEKVIYNMLEFIKTTFKSMNTSLLHFSFIFFILILFLLVFIIYVTLHKIIITPLNIIKNILKDIARGDYKKKVEVKTSDEIGQLGIAFNQMMNLTVTY